jgi:hypothetical protein
MVASVIVENGDKESILGMTNLVKERKGIEVITP